jgi:hypothetical protein
MKLIHRHDHHLFGWCRGDDPKQLTLTTFRTDRGQRPSVFRERADRLLVFGVVFGRRGFQIVRWG